MCLLVCDNETGFFGSIIKTIKITTIMSKKYIKNFDALRTPGNDIVFSCRLTVMRQQENCKAAESLVP